MKQQWLIIIAIVVALTLVLALVFGRSSLYQASGPKASSSPQGQAKSVSTLFDVIPRRTDHYVIDYTIGPDGSTSVYVTPLSQYSSGQEPQYTNELRQHRDEAINFVKERVGNDLSKLVITVEPNPDDEN